MDPLRFAEEDETGKLPYEQFQRLEYEALAARKRKTLASRREIWTKTATPQRGV
jgi:general transcription factor 3C polypeptide 3 (transcription factor C subunit 4)